MYWEWINDWQTWVVIIIVIFIVLWIYIKVSDPTLTSTGTSTQNPDINTVKTGTNEKPCNEERIPIVASLTESSEQSPTTSFPHPSPTPGLFATPGVAFLTKEEADDEEELNEIRKDPAQSIGERECTKVFRELFGQHSIVIQTRNIPWLVNPLTNRKLELDVWCPTRRIACEYNGEGHYKVVKKFHKFGERSLNYQIWKDNIKIQKCKENDVHLITVPYWIKPQDIRQYIIDALPETHKHFAPSPQPNI